LPLAFTEASAQGDAVVESEGMRLRDAPPQPDSFSSEGHLEPAVVWANLSLKSWTPPH